jgi:hypothetical protein
MSLPTDVTIVPGVLAALAQRGFALDGAPFSVRRPDRPALPMRLGTGARVVVKLYGHEEAERMFAQMQAVWQSAFGASRATPAMAEPLDCFPELGAVVMARLDGQPLATINWRHGDHLETSIRLLVELHASGAQPETKRSSRAIVRSAERKAARIAELAPENATLAREVAVALEARRVKERELVPSHGDFSPRNVLVHGAPFAFIDWDRLQLADPARDVAYFGSYGWSEALRRGRKPDREPLCRAAGAYEAARPGARLKQALPFHLAMACLRRTASVLELWPEERWLAAPLLRCALRELEEPA